MNIDEGRMQNVIQAAFDKVSGSRRWQTAIAKAKQEIESNPFMHFDGQSLLILSPSGEIYTANDACQCKAHANGHPCWHRAAARLIQRYNEGARVVKAGIFAVALTAQRTRYSFSS